MPEIQAVGGTPTWHFLRAWPRLSRGRAKILWLRRAEPPRAVFYRLPAAIYKKDRLQIFAAGFFVERKPPVLIAEPAANHAVKCRYTAAGRVRTIEIEI